MPGEVIADDPLVVGALADLLLALGADANEATLEKLNGDVGRRRVFLAHSPSANALGDVDQLHARRVFREVDLRQQVFNPGHQRLPSSASQILRRQGDGGGSGRLAVDQPRPGGRRAVLLKLKDAARTAAVSGSALAMA